LWNRFQALFARAIALMGARFWAAYGTQRVWAWGARRSVASATLAGCAAIAVSEQVHTTPHGAVNQTTLAGKVALVTGGTGSIGWAVAQGLAAQGCSVVLVDLDETRCSEFAARLPTPSIGMAIDVSSETAVKQGYSRVVERLGPVDILVNVAGILSNNKVFETSAEEWRRVHAVNYDACFYLAKACLPHMQQQQWGRVVNLSSWAWKSGGLTAGTAYSASKGALVGLTFSLARQFAADGITVNAVAPCYVFSPMIMEQLTEAKRAELLDTIPVKRFCAPEEVAHAVMFLVSPLSGFITGEVVDMNGGFQMD